MPLGGATPPRPGLALQGNLDPSLFASRAVLDPRSPRVLAEAPTTGYVFNLGHGVPPETDPGLLAHVVELVHAHRVPRTGTA